MDIIARGLYSPSNYLRCRIGAGADENTSDCAAFDFEVGGRQARVFRGHRPRGCPRSRVTENGLLALELIAALRQEASSVSG